MPRRSHAVKYPLNQSDHLRLTPGWPVSTLLYYILFSFLNKRKQMDIRNYMPTVHIHIETQSNLWAQPTEGREKPELCAVLYSSRTRSSFVKVSRGSRTFLSLQSIFVFCFLLLPWQIMTSMWASGNVHRSVGQKSLEGLCLDGFLA